MKPTVPPDPSLQNLALSLSLEFGANWRRPIQERLRAQRPELSAADADELNELATSARDWAHGIIRTAVGRGAASEEDARARITQKYPWIDEETLAHLWSQGVYYAMK